MESLLNINTFLSFLMSELDIKEESFLDPNSVLVDLEYWDSLMVMTLLAVCDETYNIELDPDELDDCKTTEDLYKLVKKSVET